VTGPMPRPRPPYLHREETRHGRVVWYLRIGKGPRVRTKSAFGSPEFDPEYQAAVACTSRPAEGASVAGTLAWLIERYRETTAWAALSGATRRQRENVFVHIVESAGTQPIHKITPATIVAGRERRAKTPAQARNFLDAVRGLFRWAAEAKHVGADPTLGVKNPPRRKGAGFVRGPKRTSPLREAMAARYTPARLARCATLYGPTPAGCRAAQTPSCARGYRYPKDRKGRVYSHGVVADPFGASETLEAGPCGDLTFVAGANGRPLTKESFGNVFKQACRSAGVPGSAHGVRKIAATRAAENGATVAELEAIFGWHGGTMASHYTREADRVRLAKAAMHKLANDERTSIPAPKRQVGGSERKIP
jgi:Phage integrase family